MAFVPFGDPVEIDLPDEEEEARRRREAEEAIGAQRLAEIDRIQVPAPPGQPPAPPESLRAEAEDAARVGTDFRARGGVAAPSSVRVAPQTGHAGTQRILTFDDQTTPPPAAPPPIPPRGGAASTSSAGRSLSSPVAQADRRPAAAANARGPGVDDDPGRPVAGSTSRAAGAVAEQGDQRSAPTQTPMVDGVNREDLRARLAKRLGGEQVQDPAAVDHTGADVADAVRRPFHAIGAALQAASGRPLSRFRSLGDESRERERASALLAARQGQQQSAARLAEMRAQQSGQDASARRDLERERLRQAGERDASLDRYRTGQLENQRARAEALGGMQTAQAERARYALQRERDLDDRDSQLTADERQAYRDRIQLVPEHLRGQFPENLADNLPARQIERLHRQLDRYGIRDVRRGRGGSGGGPSASRQALQQRAAAVGMDQTQIDSYGRDTRRLTSEVERRERERRASGGADGEGTEIMQGVRSPLSLAAGEGPRLRDGLASGRASMRNINQLGSIHERFGGLSARISPAARAEIVPRLTMAANMVAQMGGTGVITEGEMPRILAALPDPADLAGMTFGTFQARLDTWRDLLESEVRAQLGARSVPPEGIDAAVRFLRSGGGGGQQGGGQQSDTVSVVRPDGTRGTIPRRLAAQARARGWTVNDGPR